MYFKEKFRKRNVSLDLRLKKIDEIRNNFSEEVKHNDLMSEKYLKSV